MEQHLISAALKDRASLYLILDYITTKEYSREFQILIEKIKDYYDRDANADHVVREVFVEGLAATIQNPKHLENFVNFLNEAEALDTSAENIQEFILEAKKQEVGLKLSVALVNGDKKVAELMEQYRELSHYKELDDLAQKGVTILTWQNIDQVVQKKLNRAGTLKVYPLALNERLDGGLDPGHHLVTFARPEMGKTAFNVNVACGFARQGAEGIYFINEDRVEDIYMRLIYNLAKMTKKDFERDPTAAIDKALANGLKFIHLIDLSPGTPRQVEALVDKLRPKWVVMDQLRNLDMGEQNKVLQLEKATTCMRTLAKKYSYVGVSTTQAGDSAEGKALLTMGDVDFSNTGVAAQADVLVGIGGTPNDVAEGRRIINISKNKVSGRHENFPVRLFPEYSIYSSYRNQGEE